MKKILLILLCIFILSTLSFTEEINVCLEPLPPLIIDANNGVTIDLLKEIEKITDFKFKIKIASYARAKIWLKSGKYDLIAHTPYKFETKEFYAYAQELDFSLPVKLDIYYKNNIDFSNLKTLKIGVPFGNEDFASEVLGIPKESFQKQNLTNLIKMLENNRIDIIWFERASVMSAIHKAGLKSIKYKEYSEVKIDAGFAVRNDRKGNILRERLEKAIKIVNKEKILEPLKEFYNLPESGYVK